MAGFHHWFITHNSITFNDSSHSTSRFCFGSGIWDSDIPNFRMAECLLQTSVAVQQAHLIFQLCSTFRLCSWEWWHDASGLSTCIYPTWGCSISIYIILYIYAHSSRWYIPHMFSILILHLSNVNRFSTRTPPGKVVEMFDSSGWVNPRIPIWQYRLWKKIAKVSGIKIDYPWLSGSSG